MTLLAHDELVTTLTRDFTVTDELINVKGIRVRLLVRNMPAGTFTFAIKSGSTTLKTYSFTAASARASFGGTKSHFWIDHSLQGDLNLASGDYAIELSSTGYTYDPGSCLSWVKSHEYVEDLSIDSTYISFANSRYFFTLIEERLRGVHT